MARKPPPFAESNNRNGCPVDSTTGRFLKKPATPTPTLPTPIVGMKRQAAEFIAQAQMPREDIAARCDVSLEVLAEWEQEPDFREEVRRYLADMRDEAYKTGIATRASRLVRLNDRWDRCQQIIRERAAYYRQQGLKFPGSRTGLLKARRSPKGDLEYVVDAELLREIRELEAQAALEMGDWDKNARPQQAPVVLVISPGQNVQPGQRLAERLPQAERPALPSVTIDLVPDRGGSSQ